MILISKLTFWMAYANGLGSIEGKVSNQAETYMMGADTNVLITIPEVICKEIKLRKGSPLHLNNYLKLQIATAHEGILK